jgi:hypothetical protein
MTPYNTRIEYDALSTSLTSLPPPLHHNSRPILTIAAVCAAAGVVGEELQKAVDERSLPPWIWFMWIPQLLTSLTRPETHRVKPILKQLAEVRLSYQLSEWNELCPIVCYSTGCFKTKLSDLERFERCTGMHRSRFALADVVMFAASLLCLQMHPQSIYYSLRTFVLGLREAAQRALQEHSKYRAGLEAAVSAALEAAGGDEQSEHWALQAARV